MAFCDTEEREKLGGAEKGQMHIRGTLLFIPKGIIKRIIFPCAVQRLYGLLSAITDVTT